MMLDDAPGLHPGRLADDVDGHRDRHRLVAADGEEVDVEVPTPDVVALDLTGKREVLCTVDLEVDQHVGTGAAVQDVEQILGVHRHGHRPNTVPVQDGGHAAGRSELARRALAALFSLLRLELQLHGFCSSPRPSGASRLPRPRIVPTARSRRPPRPGSEPQSWFSPRKISETEVSSNTARSALAMMGAIDSTRSLANCFSSGIGTVFVSTTPLIGASSKSCTALPDKTPCVAAA